MDDMTLGHLLSERARLSPNKEGLVDRENRYTFAELNQRVNKFANYLNRLGIKSGDRIALVARNSEIHATTVLAAAKLGAISVIINWRLASPEIEYIFEDSKPVVLVYQSEFSTLLDEVSKDLRPSIQICETDFDSSTDNLSNYMTMMMTSDNNEPAHRLVNANDPVVIMYTSGTTGRSKGAVLTHKNLYTAAHGSSCTIDWNINQRFLLAAPMFHIGGLFYLFGNIMRGTSTIMLPDFKPALTWEIIDKEKISMMMTVPAMLRAMFDAPEINTVDRSRLEYLICGGSSVNTELFLEGATHGIDVQIVYGATEFTGPITFWVHKDDPDGLGSVGRVVMNGEAAIFDPNTLNCLDTGVDGEIWLRGPMTFAGFWQNEKASADVLVDDWYRTGDIGYLDAEGRIYVKERLKDMIISGGENIYPAEIETVLNRHDSIAEVTVVGYPDERWGEIPVAFVVPTPNTTPSAQEIIDYCKKNIASYKSVKKVFFLDELPKNAVGKILKRKLRMG